MEAERQIAFGPFRLETVEGRLWRGNQVISLRPRSLAMLSYLATHPGRLMTKAEVRQHVWAGTHVTDTVLRVCVQEIRKALGDSAAAPRYLETVGRQGYRFLAGDNLEGPRVLTDGPLVGRQGEVEALEERYQQASHGARQIVFISGAAGVGKTTAINLFLNHVATRSEVWSSRGQCVELVGEGEPYLPFLGALGRLGHGAEQDEVRAVLRRYAPLWLAQLPVLASETELERLQGRLHGATPARMLRELAEALEALTADRTLVLILEDMQWSDQSTVDALAYLAQRPEPARLLVLGTYRPVDVVLREHSLRSMVQELCGRGQGEELRLEFLSAADVAAYVAGRLGGPVASSLAAFVYARTDGNALFMVNIVAHLAQLGVLQRQAGQWALRIGTEAQVESLPEGLRGLLLRRIEALPPTVRQVLEAASVVGRSFEVAAAAAGDQCTVEEAEARCEALAAQRHLLDDAGWTVWPDTTSGGRYRFQHALYQRVLYEQMGTARRVQLHQRIGARLETGYGARAGEIAARLAVHFECGGETSQAVHYWQQAGENARRQNAHHEAIVALRKGLALLLTLPDSPERSRRELALQLTLGALLMAAKGMVSPEAGEAYKRAHALCQQVGESRQLFRALFGLIAFYNGHGGLRIGEELGRQLLDLTYRQDDAVLIQESHLMVGGNALYRGDLVAARAHLEKSLEVSAGLQSATPLFVGRLDPRVIGYAWLLRPLWALGYVDQAQQRCQEMLALAQKLEHTPSLTLAEYFAAMLLQARRDAAATYASAEALMVFATSQGLTHRVEQGRIMLGWALAMQGDATAGVQQIHQGLTAHRDMEITLGRPHRLSLLAEAYSRAGQPEVGLQILAEALTLVEATDERWWEAELFRLRGTLLLQRPLPDVSQAEACFQQAIDVARGQQARSLELRAAISLCRLWQSQDRRQMAYNLLSPVYNWFTEGFDTADLQETRTLLEALV